MRKLDCEFCGHLLKEHTSRRRVDGKFENRYECKQCDCVLSFYKETTHIIKHKGVIMKDKIKFEAFGDRKENVMVEILETGMALEIRVDSLGNLVVYVYEDFSSDKDQTPALMYLGNGNQVIEMGV